MTPTPNQPQDWRDFLADFAETHCPDHNTHEAPCFYHILEPVIASAISAAVEEERRRILNMIPNPKHTQHNNTKQ